MKQATANRPAKAHRRVSINIWKLRLVSPLILRKHWISVAEAVRRGRANPERNHGKREANMVCAAGNARLISREVWSSGVYAIFPKTTKRRGHRRYALVVVRSRNSFYCAYRGFSSVVRSDGKLLSFDSGTSEV